MTSAMDERVSTALRAELAVVTKEPLSSFTDDALLSDVGLDSLALIEVLVSVREQLLADLGLSADEISEPPTVPWLETVGELVAFVRGSIPARTEGAS